MTAIAVCPNDPHDLNPSVLLLQPMRFKRNYFALFRDVADFNRATTNFTVFDIGLTIY